MQGPILANEGKGVSECAWKPILLLGLAVQFSYCRASKFVRSYQTLFYIKGTEFGPRIHRLMGENSIIICGKCTSCVHPVPLLEF